MRQNLIMCALLGLMSVGWYPQAGDCAINDAKVADDRFEQAHRSYAEGDSRTALIHLRNILKQKPDNLPALVLSGEIYLSTGDGIKAEKVFRRARHLGADPSRVHAGMAEALFHQQRFRELLDRFESPAVGSKRPYDLQITRAKAWLELGEHDKAGEIFEQSYGDSPERPEAVIGLVYVDHAQGNIESLKQRAKLLSQRFTDYPQALFVAATVFVETGDHETAMELLDQVVDAVGDHLQARLTRAAIHYQNRSFSAAERDLQKIRKRFPNNPEAAFLHYQTLLALGEEDAAGNALLQAAHWVDNSPDHIVTDLNKTLMLAARIKQAQRQYEVALRFLKILVSREPENFLARRRMAAIYHAIQRHEEAIETLKPARAQVKTDALASVLLASSQIHSGQMDAALTGIESSTVSSPGLSLQKAVAMAILGDTRPAEEVLADLVEEGAETQRATLMAAALAFQAGDNQGAKRWIASLPEQGGESAAAQNLFAAMLISEGKLDAAVEVLNSAIGLSPGLLPLQINQLQLMVRLGRVDEAIDTLIDLTERFPNQPRPYTDLARLYEKQGRIREAIAILSTLHKRRPDDVSAMLYLSRLWLVSSEPDRFEKAMTSLSTLPVEAQDLTQVRLQRIAIRLAAGNKAAARTGLIQLQRGDTTQLEHVVHLARLWHKLGDYGNAISALNAGATHFESDPGALMTLAHQFLAYGDAESAISMAEKVIALAPNLAAAHSLAASISFRRQKLAQAHRFAQNAFGLQPSHAHARLLAEIRAREGDLTGALRWLEKFSIDTGREDPLTNLRLADWYLAVGDPVGAEERYRHLLKTHPNSVAALNNLALILVESDRLQDAKALVDKALALEQSAAVFETSGRVEMRLGLFESAIRKLRYATVMDSSDSEIRLRLAEALVRAGQHTAAKLEWQRALKNVPALAETNLSQWLRGNF